MERVLRMLLSIITHLFVFSVFSLFAGFTLPDNPFASILGMAGFFGLVICVYTLIMHLVFYILNRLNGNE